MAEDVARADGQLVARLPLKVFPPTCKKVLSQSWTDGDPPTIKLETLIKIVFGARRRVLGVRLRRGVSPKGSRGRRDKAPYIVDWASPCGCSFMAKRPLKGQTLK